MEVYEDWQVIVLEFLWFSLLYNLAIVIIARYFVKKQEKTTILLATTPILSMILSISHILSLYPPEDYTILALGALITYVSYRVALRFSRKSLKGLVIIYRTSQTIALIAAISTFNDYRLLVVNLAIATILVIILEMILRKIKICYKN
ncbi:hypothetical protein [Thermococcus barossii]|uniref:Uncharacterized protein n=1 Tax=Thermococcus barossii TaxID=54077 RepID=A0A2Z2MUC1_9EURY|nr:hypothetical protein [Thermococcus barossii]ASJ05608.1 hypothetical protein A3L01_09625 [Thermococcus barossii]